jgi:competence protein ComEA
MRFKATLFALLLATQPFVGNMALAADAVAAPEQPAAQQMEISKLNINTATAEQFMALKGIGKKKAEAIIAWRTEHGGFKSVEELAEVKGISERFVTEHQTELTLD